MSADLLEAFGNLDTKSKQDPETNIATPNGLIYAAKWSPTTFTRQSDKEAKLWKQDEDGTDVLFDASQDTEDDFGDFEDAQLSDAPDLKNSQSLKPSFSDSELRTGNTKLSLGKHSNPLVGDNQRNESHVNLVDIDDTGETDKTPSDDFCGVRPESKKAQLVYEVPDNEWGVFQNVDYGQKKPQKAIGSSSMVPVDENPNFQQQEDLEEWDAFDDGPAHTALPPRIPETSTGARTRGDVSEHVTLSKRDIQNQSRPTNIPPPFTLLQLLPNIYQQLSRKKPTETNYEADRHHAMLVLQTYVVTARVISGRSQRWKRDTILSQSMRISQAGVRASGMKLTALDRGEAVKEDQQAIDVVNMWSKHAHALNAIMARAKVSKPPMSLSHTMIMRTATGPGILSAKEICPVCGLKRNERVLGIDVNIDDTFGEFWIDHWGHKDCFDFWYEYKSLLDQR